MSVRIITNQELKEAVRRALADGTLQALHESADSDGCSYDDGQGHRCAIGSALTDDEILCISRKKTMFGSLNNASICPDRKGQFEECGFWFEDLEFAIALQQAHDDGPIGIDRLRELIA